MAKQSPSKIETGFEKLLFASRWILAPAYAVLIVAMFMLMVDTFVELYQLISYLIKLFYNHNVNELFGEIEITIQVLTIADLVLVLNLLIMIIFVGYTNFVSAMYPTRREDVPDWFGTLDYSGLKLRVMGSVIAISTVKMLRVFLALAAHAVPQNSAPSTSEALGFAFDRNMLTWTLAIYASFLVGALIIAIVNKLEPSPKEEQERLDLRETRLQKLQSDIVTVGAERKPA